MPNYGRMGGGINATGTLASRMRNRSQDSLRSRGRPGMRRTTNAYNMKPRENMGLQLKNLMGIGNRKEQRQYQQMMGGPPVPPTGGPPTTGPGVPNPNPPAVGPGSPGLPPGPPDPRGGQGTLGGSLSGSQIGFPGATPGGGAMPINPIEPIPPWQGPMPQQGFVAAPRYGDRPGGSGPNQAEAAIGGWDDTHAGKWWDSLYGSERWGGVPQQGGMGPFDTPENPGAGWPEMFPGGNLPPGAIPQPPPPGPDWTDHPTGFDPNAYNNSQQLALSNYNNPGSAYNWGW